MGQNGGGERPRLSGGHQRDVAFVALLRSGDPSAFGLLFDTWIDPVYDRISHRSFTTADVADLSAGTFAATHRRVTQQTNTDPFRVVLFRAARQETIAAADRRVDLHMPVGPYAEDRLVRGADAAGLAADPAVAALLWQSADVLGDQARDVLDLRHRHDFSPEEIATVMNLTPDAVDDILRKVPKGLTAVVRAMVVWRQGTPAHDELATALGASNGFDTSTVRTIAEHQRSCESCRDAGKLSVDPLSVFSAIPLAVAPVGFKEQVVDRLREQDLPIDASVSYRAGEGAAVAMSASVAEEATTTVDEPGPADEDHRAAAGLGIAGAGAIGAAAVASAAGRDTGIDDGPETATADTGTDTTPEVTTPDAETANGADADHGSDSTSEEESGSPWDPLIRPATALGGAAATGAAAYAATSAPASATSLPASAAASAAPLSGAGSATPGAPRPAPKPSPAMASDDPDGSRSNRKLLYIGIAAVAVILLIGGLVLSQTGKKSDSTDLTATSNSSLTTVTTAASTSSSIAATTTTGVPVTGDTTPPDSSTDSTATPTTKVPTTVTIPGQPVVPSTVEAFPTFQEPTMTISATVMTSGVDQAITLTWNVVASKPVTVAISGPGGFSSTTTSGSAAVCPGTIDSGGICTAPNGVYAYRLTATDHLGRLVYSKTVQFTVKHL